MDFSLGYSKEFFTVSNRHWLLKTDIRLYGSGRAAFLDILRSLKIAGIDTLWMPVWQCHELVESLSQVSGVKIKFYQMSLDLKPSNIELETLDPKFNAILVVDYFASCDASQLDFWINNYTGFLLFDCVHSWLMSDIAKKINRKNVVIVSGFRKIFFKFCGALVTGDFARSLPQIPSIIHHSSSNFPRNFSLTIRFGVLSKLVLKFVNLGLLDKIACKWRTQESRSKRQIWFDLISPMKLLDVDTSDSKNLNSRWHWPELYGKLAPLDLKSAEILKYKYVVIKNVHKETYK